MTKKKPDVKPPAKPIESERKQIITNQKDKPKKNSSNQNLKRTNIRCNFLCKNTHN